MLEPDRLIQACSSSGSGRSSASQEGPIGPVRTPLARLGRLFPADRVPVWAKLESLQPAGSMKERSAQFLLDDLECSALASAGTTLIASTSGNFGVALARQAAVRGMRLVAVVDGTANRAALQTMRAFGAEIDVVDVPDDGNRLAARLARVTQLAGELPDSVVADQYTSAQNPRAHAATTMPEIVEQLGSAPTVLYIAASTGGTMLGCQQAIEEHHWPTRLVAVDAEGSVLFGGRDGVRHLPGLGAGVVSHHARQARPDGVRRIAELDMIRGARRLARSEGLLAGASTGAVVAAIEHDLSDLDPGSVVAMLVHDSGLGYLDTVYDDDWVARTYGPDAVAAVA